MLGTVELPPVVKETDLAGEQVSMSDGKLRRGRREIWDGDGEEEKGLRRREDGKWGGGVEQWRGGGVEERRGEREEGRKGGGEERRGGKEEGRRGGEEGR